MKQEFIFLSLNKDETKIHTFVIGKKNEIFLLFELMWNINSILKKKGIVFCCISQTEMYKGIKRLYFVCIPRCEQNDKI